MELSEDRHHREHSEEIKMIKARVSDLFKKMKPLTEEDEDEITQSRRAPSNKPSKEYKDSGVGSSRLYDEDRYERSS